MTAGSPSGHWRDVYIPFRSGALAHACGPCGVKCCKGAGLGFDVAGLTQLRARRPELALFVSPSDSTSHYVSVNNFESACFFLRDDGLCDVHATRGRDAKPFLCKAFPTSAYRLAGDVLVVDLNVYCPVHPAGRVDGEHVLHHDAILRDIEDNADVVRSLLKTRRVPRSWSLGDEERLRDAAGPAPTPSPAHAWHERICRFVELDIAWRPEVLVDHALMAPRQRLLFHELWTEHGGPAPEAWIARATAIHQTFILAATQLGREPSLTGADAMLRMSAPLYAFLGMLDAVPRIAPQPDDAVDALFHELTEPLVARFLSFVYDENDARELTLAQIFDALEIHGAMDRTALLRSLSWRTFRLMFEDAAGAHG